MEGVCCNIGLVLGSGGEWVEVVCGNSWGTWWIQDCKPVVGEASQSILCLCLFVVFVVEDASQSIRYLHLLIQDCRLVVEEASQSIQVDPLAQMLEVCLQIP